MSDPIVCIECGATSYNIPGKTPVRCAACWEKLKDRAEKAEARVAELENSWLVDESIQPDGSLRPSVKAEAVERERELLYTHIKALNTALDELCPLVARVIDWLPVNQFTLIAKTREALNNMTDVQNRSYKIDGIVIETSRGDQNE